MIYGREVERARIAALLADARSSRSGALVLRGDAGIGKTMLLDEAVARADGMVVLRASGVESEAELAFAGLHQVLLPLLELLPALPASQAGALASAFGLGGEEVGNRFLASLATLGLLAEAAGDRGLLCVVDDAHWLDVPTAEALLFAARRLEAEGVAMLFAARDGAARPFEAPGLPELRLDGLPREAAAALLGARAGPALAPPVHERLLAYAAGNPLALIELAGALSDAQLAGRAALIEPLPIGESVERAFLERVHALAPEAQTMLLIAAADDSGDLALALRAAGTLGIDAAALDLVEAAGLVRVEGPAIAFRHPLVRSAVYRGAGFSPREQAHLALAASLPGEADADRRAWHLAASSRGPSEEIAGELERTAVRARLRGGHAAAATALERAAQLSEDDASRGRRLLAAADANWLGGRPRRTGPLLEQADPLPADGAMRARAAWLRGSYEFERGNPQAAYEVLVAGAEEVRLRDPRLALEMLVRAAEAAAFSGHLEWTAAISELAARIPTVGREEQQFMAALLHGTAEVLQGDVALGIAALEKARGLAAGFTHPRYLIFAAFADSYLGDFAVACARHGRAVAQLRSAGAVGELPLALQLLAAAQVWTGQLGTAAANAAEGLRLARETGQETNASFVLGTLARADAAQGREADCRAHAEEAMRLAAAHGLPLPGAVGLLALGSLELGLGHPDEALVHLAAISDRGSVGPVSPLVVLFAAPDFVEAAVRAGRHDTAVAALARFEPWAAHTPAPWPRAAAARMRALLAEGEEAERHFEDALAHHAEAELPFEHARTLLLHGAHLRRRRRRADARPHLRAALAAFERVGAEPWAERARGELRATGETARRREPSTIDQLTPQELQIARFVSAGASNREVAARLFLSPRTVEYHLRKVFTKLGIAARSELARLLPPDEAGATGDPTGGGTDATGAVRADPASTHRTPGGVR